MEKILNQIDKKNIHKIEYYELLNTKNTLNHINELLAELVRYSNSIECNKTEIDYKAFADQMEDIKVDLLKKDIEIIDKEIKTKEEIIKNIYDLNNKKIEINSLDKLIENVENPYQKDSLNKILLNAENDRIYFRNYADNNKKSKQHLIGTISVFGTFNKTKQKREVYDINIYDENNEETFTCSCYDFRYNSKKKNTVCKHICFIVCKICKIYNIEFFKSKKLDKNIISNLINKISDKNLLKDKTISKQFTTLSYSSFFDLLHYNSNEENNCVICYGDILEDEVNNNKCISCPKCNNIFHKECKEVWLEEHMKCAYCNNNIWKYYNELENDKSKNIVMY
jgi:hypothetical protein